ncbi:MAG: efflux RND transporter periplasmic adaptor subunit [Chlamydiota bacterium]
MKLNNKKRLAFYFLTVIIFIIAVVARKHVINNTAAEEAVTIYGIQHSKGKPVVVSPIIPRCITLSDKITLLTTSPTTLEGYVSKKIQRALTTGETIPIYQGSQRFTASITAIDNKIDLSKGLYRITLQNAGNDDLNDGRYIASFPYQTTEEVIAIPSEILQSSSQGHYVWVFDDGQASSSFITLGERGDYGVIIVEGLEANDLLIVQGQTKLFEGDKVRIINSEE